MTNLQGDIEVFGAAGHNMELSDLAMCRDAMRVLNTTYPGYRWMIGVNSEGGIMYIKNLDISGLWGYVLHMTKMVNDPTMKRVRRAGGEILERAWQKRGKATGDPTVKVDGLPKKHQPLMINGYPLIR